MMNKRVNVLHVAIGYRKCIAHGVKKYLNGWFYVYCENTNLHGFRYINSNGSLIENIFWFLVCISSIVFCVILMMRLWANYSNNPIVTTIYTSNPIWDVSFPGVTICNNNKVYRAHADPIAKYLYKNGFTASESDKFFSSLMKLIRPDKISIDNVTAMDVLDYLDVTVETLMEQLMQPCSALLLRCAWIGKIHDCGKIFKTVKSREGFCCAFNSHYDLNIEHLSSNNTPSNFTNFNETFDDLPGVDEILKAPGSGRDVGLAVALNIEPDMYKATSRPYVGASVMIHDPIDFPDIGAHLASVPPGHVLAISVTGTSIRAMESLRNIPLQQRLCFFDNEIPGEVHYSYQSCISDCIAKLTYRLCGCLPFYHPETHGMRTCFLPDINCLLNFRESSSDFGNCRKCLPQCTDMLYNISPEDIKMNDIGFDSDLTHGLDVNNVSFVYVFFGDISYVEYRKDSILSWDSLLASFGGIFGLCLGGSVMSVIELAYLLTRHLFRRQPRKKQEQVSRTSLPPASEVFLSIPIKEKSQLQELREHQGSDNKRILLTWYQPALHYRKADLGNVHRKNVKF
ncbi:pickpocket protein 28-like [Pogonomyrmex barbatus]|uniref:Pickpocket protein 28-like n=1 Tax=Pogonomyrmex barbatus TaxID=144034 RepID=A0A6I9VWC6_9HYME|nr:pickpocket protein 28-like [Pogonomyrmex barbatus]